MAKITKVEDGKVFIEKEDGSVIEADRENIDFAVKSGMVVNVSDDGHVSLAPEPVKEEPKAEAATSTATADNSSQPAASQMRLVDKTTYCLLAFFLGGIGIHQFYAGKTLYGVLHILFCWTLIPSIIAFVQFIIAICKPADSQGRIYM